MTTFWSKQAYNQGGQIPGFSYPTLSSPRFSELLGYFGVRKLPLSARKVRDFLNSWGTLCATMRSFSPMVSTGHRTYRTKSGHSGIRAFYVILILPLVLVALPGSTFLTGFCKSGLWRF